MRLTIAALSAVLLIAACEGAEDAGRRDSVSGAVSEKGDPGSGGDAATSPDAAEVDGGCKDLRHPADGKDEADTCWDPPLHYCSAGWGEGGSVYCNFDSDPPICCPFASGCALCGWKPCLEGCPSYDDVYGSPACEPYLVAVGPEIDICWDGLPGAR